MAAKPWSFPWHFAQVLRVHEGSGGTIVCRARRLVAIVRVSNCHVLVGFAAA